MRGLHISADIIERAAGRRAQEIDQQLLLAAYAVVGAVLRETSELRIGPQQAQQTIGNRCNCVISSEAGAERIDHFPSVGSVENFDDVTRSNHPLAQHGAINTGRTVVPARDAAQDFWVRRGRIRVKGNHLAAGVTLEHGYQNF